LERLIAVPPKPGRKPLETVSVSYLFKICSSFAAGDSGKAHQILAMQTV